MRGGGGDAREQIVALTARGAAIVPRPRRQWEGTNAAARALDEELSAPLAVVLGEAIAALERVPFGERIATALRTPGGRRPSR